MKRRDFILKTILGSLSIYSLRDCSSERKDVLELFPPALKPETVDEKTMQALADTVLPGSNSDPEGEPGALDAGALTVLFDKSYPAYQFIPLISYFLNTISGQTFGKDFYELELNERTQLLENVEKQVSYVSLLTKFIKGAFYAAFVNDVGYKYMEYSGPNLGYRETDFSFNRQMSNEMTNDGSLP